MATVLRIVEKKITMIRNYTKDQDWQYIFNLEKGLKVTRLHILGSGDLKSWDTQYAERILDKIAITFNEIFVG